MTLYENRADRVRQSYVARELERFLSQLPIGRVEVRETPQSRAASHDLDVYVSGTYVGVGEVKCRRDQYTLDYFIVNGWAFDMPRLTALRRQFYLAGKWTKSVSLLLCTADDRILLTPITTLTENWGELQQAAPSFAKDDHGTKPVGKSGIVIPLNLMTLIK